MPYQASHRERERESRKRVERGREKWRFKLSLSLSSHNLSVFSHHSTHLQTFYWCTRVRPKRSEMFLGFRGQMSKSETWSIHVNLDKCHDPVCSAGIARQTLPPRRWDGCVRSPAEEPLAWSSHPLLVVSKCTALRCPWRPPPVGHMRNMRAGQISSSTANFLYNAL